MGHTSTLYPSKMPPFTNTAQAEFSNFRCGGLTDRRTPNKALAHDLNRRGRAALLARKCQPPKSRRGRRSEASADQHPELPPTVQRGSFPHHSLHAGTATQQSIGQRLSLLFLGRLRIRYLAGWSRRKSSHSSISVPLDSTQIPCSPAVVFSMRVLPPNLAQ